MATARRGALGRRDDNEADLVKKLRAVPGVTVVQLNHPSDILIGYCETNLLVEIKDGSKPPSKRKLTGEEAKFHRTWMGQVDIAECWADLVSILLSINPLATIEL